MKKSIAAIAVVVLIQVILVSTGWCDWWIFRSQSTDEVHLSLFLNGTSFDELVRKVTIYQETLRNGEVLLKGKVTTGKNQLVRAEVSLDGKSTWQNMSIDGKGIITYRYRPAVDNTYKMYVRVTDSANRTNDVNATFREITVSNQNILQIVNRTLRDLVRAYQDKNAAAFMANVDSEFVGDPMNLDRALRKEFSFFDNVSLSYTINNMTASQNKIYVSLTYNRSLTSSRTGGAFRDSGITDYTFTISGGKLKIYSMKNPLIFGVSDTTNLATGNAANNPSTKVLVIDSGGRVSAQPYKNIVSGTANSSATIDFQFSK